jgi:hypothetical protein
MNPRAAVITLYLKIVLFARGILAVGVETNRPRTHKPLHVPLCLKTDYFKIVLLCDYTERKLCKGYIVFEYAPHKIVVDRAERFQPLQIPLMLKLFSLLFGQFHNNQISRKQ